jgi:hypothetical protein
MMFMKCAMVLLMMCVAMPVAAEEKSDVFSMSGQGTYGSYSGSMFRDSLYSERLNLNYAHGVEYGGGLTAAGSHINMKYGGGDDINDTNLGGTLFWTPKTSGGSYIGAKVSLLNITGTFDNYDGMYIPYVSVIFKSSDLSKYLDLGYARSEFNDTTASQYTLTGGISLFNGWVWSQTRLYFIDLTIKVPNKGSTFAVEERLTYYVVPQKFDVSLYGMAGQRIYAYDPDINSSYNLDHVQTGSAGISANYNFTKNFAAFADVTYELYKQVGYNPFENMYHYDNYATTYYTAGLRVTFY